MDLIRVFLALALLMLPVSAFSQGSSPTTPQHVVCDSGCSGGSGGGTVDQGTGGSSAWKVTFGGTDQPVTVSSGTVTFSNTSIAVTGTFWPATQPISAVSLPLPTNAATDAKQDTGNASLLAIDTSTGRIPALGQAVRTFSVPMTLASDQPDIKVAGSGGSLLAQENGNLANLDALLSTRASTSLQTTTNTALGSLTETAPATDTASSGVNGRLQRISQRLTTLIPPQGQALAAASLPVVLTAAQLAALTPAANASTNVAQLAGTTTDTNSGTKSAGTLRVVLATDQPALTNKLLVTPDSVALPANQSINVSQVNGVTTLTGTGATNTGSQRVTVAVDSATVAGSASVPTGSNIVGRVGIDQTTPGTTNRVDVGVFPDNEPFNIAQMNGVTVLMGTGATGTGAQRVTVAVDSATVAGSATLPAGNNNIGDVDIASIVPPTLTKATQGATGFSTQDLKDAGRTAKSFYANNVAAGTTTTETLITLTQSSGTGATTSAASYTITSGKTFRVTALSVGSRGNATATVQSTIFNLRMNTAGACIVSSTPILFAAQSATPAVISAWDRVILPIPDGYEISGNGTIAICLSAAATFTTNAPTWSVNLMGYEY